MVFTDDYKEQPFWWDLTPRPAHMDAVLPTAVDTLIIGAGYTGLSAAIETARGGHTTLVLDAQDVGWGCSTRNGGQISEGIKPTYSVLEKRHGRDLALALLKEGQASRQWTEDFINDENIECNFESVGRFHAAHNSSQFEKLAKSLKTKIPGLADVDAHVIARADQHKELGTDAYYGGVVYNNHASFDPALYHNALMERALQSGAGIISHCPVTNMAREKEGFSVQTPKGIVKAKKVILATNGYSGSLSPWHRRRVIPIGSYMIATEPLAPEVMERLMPANRIITDTRKVVYYYRPSPDRTRIIFGGRVSLGETNPRLSGPKLHKALVALFPELATAKISHSWMGLVAFTFDTLMNVGEDDGLFYSLGYCGSGAGMAGYLGMRVGQQALGLKEGDTAFNHVKFQTRPLYKETPWFLAPSVMYYKMRDSLNI